MAAVSRAHLLANNDAIGFGSPSPLLRFVDPAPTFVPANRLRYDERTLTFTFDGQPLNLPPAQFRLLHFHTDSWQPVVNQSAQFAL